jgi:hypothetical protein
LREPAEAFHDEFGNIDEVIANVESSDDEWSLNEIGRHLVDSASNNQQRFIVLFRKQLPVL